MILHPDFKGSTPLTRALVISQRYICNNNISEDNATFRDPEKALQFIELYYGSTCTYHSTKK